LVTTQAIVFMIQKTRATDGAIKLLLNGKTRIGELDPRRKPCPRVFRPCRSK